MNTTIYDFSVTDINGKKVSINEYKGKLLLIVNVASKCGFTKQYKELEDLYQKYKKMGLVILGFPCNQFLSQEPGDESEIKEFCSLNYNITFPLFAKIEVNGNNADPLYKYLKKAKRGFLFTQGIKWNFTKFLITRKGNVVKRYAPMVNPSSLSDTIEKYLNKED